MGFQWHSPRQSDIRLYQLSRLLKGVARQDFTGSKYTTAMDAFYKQILLAAVPRTPMMTLMIPMTITPTGLNTIKLSLEPLSP